jgi:hypothetical protein
MDLEGIVTRVLLKNAHFSVHFYFVLGNLMGKGRESGEGRIGGKDGRKWVSFVSSGPIH